ncbi:TIGR04013 family B12-binding domain/radical SAM domain-containing protein [Cryptosporangium phraense]|uniref:TIGR04013 family B12-binding domain/radical SAM domain-containing protein n=1 Tax=Cryptosporangium phraense TaxID=2593070 RepID=A0A545AT41_9ACTN|nr:TIGR04013 family B12-binding domain/radical SAM domain-containing protein [Cryptosporangium phraense]TQS44498.1 TIGR04013 family B12-binding domain/radical SAM domain-containing protein [Cryptosporangium phraense]
MSVALVLRYRKANTYGHHALLGALEAEPPDTPFTVAFATSPEATASAIAEGLRTADRVLVLWSFYSPDAPALAVELATIRTLVDDDRVLHVAGGVHATAEPQQVLDAGWDVAAIGEGETTLLRLVDAGDSLTGVRGLAVRDSDGVALRTGPAITRELDAFGSFSLRHHKYGPIELTRGCIYACKFCQTPFMFSARFRHRSVENVRWHVRAMVADGMKDVRFTTPTSLSYGTQTEEPDLDAVEELLGTVRAELPSHGRLFFGSFPSEIRPEHVTPEAMRMLRKYVSNDNIIIGAQSGSDRMLAASRRGHGAGPVLDAVRIAAEAGFRPNVDFLFGMPGESSADADASLTLAREVAALGGRVHAHTFMPLPGTPWRDAEPAFVAAETITTIDQLAASGALYGHWRRQAEHATQLAETAKAYPRRTPRRRTVEQ